MMIYNEAALQTHPGVQMIDLRSFKKQKKMKQYTEDRWKKEKKRLKSHCY